MNNFTLVTGLWDIKRGELKDFNRSFDHYLLNFEKLLSLDFNMCIYIPSDLKGFVEKKRSYRNTKIIYRETEDFRKSFDFYREVQDIRTREKWYKQADWLENSPQAQLSLYNPIVMSKYFMINDCNVINPFGSTHFFWIDAGLTNTVDLELLKNLENIPDYMRVLEKKLLFLSYPYETESEVHGFKATKFSSYCKTEKTKYVCRGGFFGGHKEAIQKFNSIYYDFMKTSLLEGFMGTEENYLTMISHLYPEFVHRFELADDGLVYPFFEMLGKIEKTITHNSNLIPWEKNKSIEELKTSLYVLGFNSPEQFKKLLSSYKKNDPDFLNHPRKIFVDNSTNKSYYPQYNSICKEYGFEHIKKEENIGICGARQFVAEHFNESDSEYYIFLEDDMNLNDPTNDLCSSGYPQYIENLYFKSLAIAHKNNYDYLKLTYTEFYGNNSVQWAWYNIPQIVRDQYFPEKSKLPEEGYDPDPPKTLILKEKRHKDLKYFEGEFYYCNWPLIFSRQGNRKVFLDVTWTKPYEQTWMSNVFQLQKQGKIKAGVLALSPISHDRFDHYSGEERKES